MSRIHKTARQLQVTAASLYRQLATVRLIYIECVSFDTYTLCNEQAPAAHGCLPG